MHNVNFNGVIMKKLSLSLMFIPLVMRGGESEIINVFIGEGKTLIYNAAEKSTKKIKTSALGGCCAVAYITLFHSGDCNAYLSHFPPAHMDRQIEKLKKVFKTSKDSDIREKKLFIVVPAEWEKNQDGRFSLSRIREPYRSHIQKLENLSGIRPTVLTYSMQNRDKSKNDLYIEITPSSAILSSFSDWHMPRKIFNQYPVQPSPISLYSRYSRILLPAAAATLAYYYKQALW